MATRLWGLPASIAEAIMLASAAIWAILILLYLAKWLWSFPEALAEFRHPVLCCFISLAPISTALVALAIQPYVPVGAAILAVIGVVGQLVFGVFRIGQLWLGGRDPTTTTPVLYLAMVAGSFVSATVLASFGYAEWSMPFVGAGVLSWLAIESVLMHRLFTAPALAPALRPTLGIQLAPPVVGCAAYLSVTSGAPDLVVRALIGYGVLQALLLIRLLPWISRSGFTASYWAFTFGVTALAFCTMRFAERGGHGPIAAAAPYAFIVTNVILAAIVLGTLWLLVRGKLLPPRLIAVKTA